ncbi:O-antigen ligase family protein [Halomonas nitroreducens]|uniref:O-antigen ligase family protein n=1 Tax=Halomonas nitroreducens TaxID=447425 RepID=A0A431V4R1_9GAMM|nr:O-antigen ligase family protein [Halomonas nitroreducens]RTR05364.1 O-antigen ligase family protein [Halomonas nitroreducens]
MQLLIFNQVGHEYSRHLLDSVLMNGQIVMPGVKAVQASAILIIFALPALMNTALWLLAVSLAILGLVIMAFNPFLSDACGSPPLPKAGRVLVLGLGIYAITHLTMNLYHGNTVAEWSRVVLPLLCLAGAMALHVRQPKASWMWIGLSIGALPLGFLAIVERLLGVDRAGNHGPLDAILFGNIGLLAGLLCLAGLGWAWARPRRWRWCVALLTGAAGGFIASALSGSRGGWIALPFALVIFNLGLVRWLPASRRTVFWFSVMGVLVAIYAFPHTGVQDRIGVTLGEVTHYLSGEEVDTGSVSLRLDMWSGAARLVKESPVLGHGEAGYDEGMRRLMGKMGLEPGILQFYHAHNDLLDAWAKAGLPGLLTLLMLYALPIVLFRSGLANPDPASRSLAMAGVLLSVCFMSFGVTYSFFYFPVGIAVYCSWLMVIWNLHQQAAESLPVNQSEHGRHGMSRRLGS